MDPHEPLDPGFRRNIPEAYIRTIPVVLRLRTILEVLLIRTILEVLRSKCVGQRDYK